MPVATPTPKAALSKTWSKRFEAYDMGMPITKGLIGSLRRIVEDVNTDNVPQRSAAIMKTHYELTWNKGFGWQITPEQSEQGLNWLKRREVLKLLEEKDKAIVENFSHFTFVGFDMIDTSSAFRLRLSVRPVYRVHSKTGAWFDYASAPWQSGAYGVGAHPSFKLMSRGTK